ncbi:hypothetical protein VII00023_16335 [Vibrio ichthyoenteri ATCC 700023]|uniref:Lipoprotein n=1 Tax=Vibrio ichthyoenteri ATCC 700023 TaxID=870968 RepID=F9S0E7_9VIBR|nr:YecR family lipoprotein [Vibrio ichthyoenteri]EGU43417.1 hypothetical protein VII00023_16335 [Vibrio ichthyoenteri ATCC 700023]
MRFKLIIALAMAANLTACANPVNKNWFVTGGSKSDATITLAYDEGLLQQAVIDEQEAFFMAQNACKAWGFKNAQSLGIPLDKCARRDKLFGCISTRYTQIYQCVN